MNKTCTEHKTRTIPSIAPLIFLIGTVVMMVPSQTLAQSKTSLTVSMIQTLQSYHAIMEAQDQELFCKALLKTQGPATNCLDNLPSAIPSRHLQQALRLMKASVMGRMIELRRLNRPSDFQQMRNRLRQDLHNMGVATSSASPSKVSTRF